MRNILLYFFLMLGALTAFSQPGNPSTRKYLVVDEVPSAASIGHQSGTVPAEQAIHLRGGFGKFSGILEQNAECRYEKDGFLPFGRARMAGDTLVIVLFGLNMKGVDQFEIRVLGDEFSTHYEKCKVRGEAPVQVIPTDQVLVLEDRQRKSGSYVVGFINFRGIEADSEAPKRWDSRRDYVPSPYTVRGPFKIKID